MSSFAFSYSKNLEMHLHKCRILASAFAMFSKCVQKYPFFQLLNHFHHILFLWKTMLLVLGSQRGANHWWFFKPKNGCLKQIFWWKKILEDMMDMHENIEWPSKKPCKMYKENILFFLARIAICTPTKSSWFPSGFDGYGSGIISERKAAKKHHLILSRTTL